MQTNARNPQQTLVVNVYNRYRSLYIYSRRRRLKRGFKDAKYAVMPTYGGTPALRAYLLRSSKYMLCLW